MIFLAEPADENEKPKSVPDEESEGAEWMSLEEFASVDHIRGPELLDYGKYIENGGLVHPMSIYSNEASELPSP